MILTMLKSWSVYQRTVEMSLIWANDYFVYGQIMDAIKGTMTEIYNDLSKSTSGNTIAEVWNREKMNTLLVMKWC